MRRGSVPDSLIGDAWLLALLVALAGMSFYFGFLYRHYIVEYYRYSAQAGFVAVLFMIALAGYFGLREKRAVDELAALIDIVPRVTDTRYVPRPGEMQAVRGILAAMSGSLEEAAELAVPPADADGERMIIFVRDDWPRPRTLVSYIYGRAPRPGELQTLVRRRNPVLHCMT